MWHLGLQKEAKVFKAAEGRTTSFKGCVVDFYCNQQGESRYADLCHTFCSGEKHGAPVPLKIDLVD